MADFDIDELFIEPRPDEDAWEAFLDLALERIGGDRSPGLTNRQIGELEEIIGCQLPFEIGLMLVMGVPAAEPWRQWTDPAAEWALWNEGVRAGITFAVEHSEFWFDGWGERPTQLGDQLTVVNERFDDTVPATFPIYNQLAVPLLTAEGAASSDGNPVLSIDHAEAAVAGVDLAAWMHSQFEVPLPMWPAEERVIPFWRATGV